jgi:hypothetical protein
MTTISHDNFNHFLSQKINLSANVLTEDLGSISRGIFGIFSRISHRNELDSRKICANIETTIQNLDRSLGEEEKKHAIENLGIMEAKFSKSEKPGKAQECIETIERIKIFINKKAPVTPRPSQAPIRMQAVPQASNKPASVTKVLQQPVSGAAQNPIQTRMDPIAFNAQKKLVDAISKTTTKIEPGFVMETSFKADFERIKEIEKDITPQDRLLQGNYKKFIHYTHNDTFFFVALRKEKTTLGSIIKHVLIKAEKIEGAIQECKKSSHVDIGALLREQIKKMGLETKTG